MRRLFLTLLFCNLGATVALAAAYDDFNQGLAAIRAGDNGRAIVLLTAAISAGDLSAGLMPVAHRNRGLAYLHTGQCQLSLDDFDAALKLKPDDVDSQIYRAGAHVCAKDLTAALADYSTILDKSPAADVYGARGLLRWRMRDFAGASEDFAQETRMMPTNPYAVLWLETARLRAGQFDSKIAGQDADKVDSRHWPAPLLSLLAGDKTADDVDREALRPDARPAEVQICEADFYMGEWALGRQDLATARARLGSAVQRCAQGQVLRAAALADWEKLQ